MRREIEKFLNYQVSKTNPACSSFKEDSLKKKNLRENYSFCDLWMNKGKLKRNLNLIQFQKWFIHSAWGSIYRYITLFASLA